ncbi:MAG: class III signal peptide-containing protein [Candidatus Diapherotrites archaeon]|nr:class III signal peptide-containing protein [Candidatus Diapherotrites archaeon]
MKAQGSFEYLLLIGGVLSIAVIVMLFVSQTISSPQVSGSVAKDRSICAQNNTELMGYTKPYDGLENAPQKIKWHGRIFVPVEGTYLSAPENVMCAIGSKPDGTKYKIYGQLTDPNSLAFYLEDANGKYKKYVWEKLVGQQANFVIVGLSSWSADNYYDSKQFCDYKPAFSFLSVNNKATLTFQTTPQTTPITNIQSAELCWHVARLYRSVRLQINGTIEHWSTSDSYCVNISELAPNMESTSTIILEVIATYVDGYAYYCASTTDPVPGDPYYYRPFLNITYL